MIRQVLLSLLAVSFLAACSTPQTRAQRNPELMARVSAEERALIEAGEIDLGFTEEMVEVAWGRPDRIDRERRAEGEWVVWAYQEARGLGRPRVSVGIGTTVGSGRGTAYGGGVSVGTGGAARVVERDRVIFSDGVVTAIERAERP